MTLNEYFSKKELIGLVAGVIVAISAALAFANFANKEGVQLRREWFNNKYFKQLNITQQESVGQLIFQKNFKVDKFYLQLVRIDNDLRKLSRDINSAKTVKDFRSALDEVININGNLDDLKRLGYNSEYERTQLLKLRQLLQKAIAQSK